MKKFKIKKMWLPIALVIVVAFLGVIAVWSIQKNDSDILKEDETSIIVSTTELTSATEKKEKKTTTEVVTKEKTSETNKETTGSQPTTNKPVVTTTNSVATTQAVVTTKAPKPTTTKPAPKPVVTTKPAKPTTTKAPKDEYYPSLTKADMEYLSKYTADYIKSKGYKHRPDLDWDRGGYSTAVGMNDDLSMYGNKYKLNGGISPLEWSKNYVRDGVDYYIEIFGEDTPYLEMDFIYKRHGTGWMFTVAYMA